MGFPVGYSELMLPKFLLHLIFILGHIRKVITWAFDVVGLGDLLDAADIPSSSWPEHLQHPSHQHGNGNFPGRHHHEVKPLSAVLIQEVLPVVRYEDLGARGCADEAPESCAVCLYEFEGGEEVRRLSNCRHIFHRCCLDPWVELDQRTCPLCRTPLIPEEMQGALDRKIWEAATATPDSSYYDQYGDYNDDGDYYPTLDDSFSLLLPPQTQTELLSWPSSARLP